ncbi:hypothetical protein KQ51_01240 [Candidatus Izimaplasma bacterium HR1]|jgi:membrane glycosyltransferase|uniref:hypothetical protein n=1 Tax=Candidatus Izimoplasma sp. HR1 TaxID=1541959 RepID=UPI0004F923B8|nr:hypothetical protein KQ51_01240 [Candidatus Izimaplasma bacterium HR1]
MIKAPITKTGEIRYLEFIKIFVLVSFFIALIMTVIDQPQFLLHISPIITGNVLSVIMVASLISTIITDLRTIFITLKEVIITFIPVYYFKTEEQFMELITPFISIFKTDLLQSKLCVVRC